MSTPGRPRRANVQQLFDTLQKDVQPQARALTNSIGMKFVLIPAGTFVMGSQPDDPRARLNEMPAQEVILTRPFYLGVHTVTQSQFQAILARAPSRFHPGAGGSPDHPVECVSWLDAHLFCKVLTTRPEEEEAHRHYRLPTEAEWEYACRAGGTTPFAFGSELSPDQAQFYDRSQREAPVRTSPCGAFPANNFGLFDMHGNVWEWCADWYGENEYASGKTRDPQGPDDGQFRVARGGCWRSQAGTCRSAYRNAMMPHNRDPYTGFRVVCEIKEST